MCGVWAKARHRKLAEVRPRLGNTTQMPSTAGRPQHADARQAEKQSISKQPMTVGRPMHWALSAEHHHDRFSYRASSCRNDLEMECSKKRSACVLGAAALVFMMEDSQYSEEELQCAYWQLAPPAQVCTLYAGTDTEESIAQLARPLVNSVCARSSAVGRAPATTGRRKSQRSRSARVFNILSITCHIPPWQRVLQVGTSVSALPPAPPYV